MHWHIDADIVSLIVVIELYICNLMLKTGEIQDNRDKRFNSCLVTGIVVTVIDIISSIIMEIKCPAPVYHTFMTLYFVSIEFVIVEWFLYVNSLLYRDKEKAGRTVSVIVRGFYVIYALFNLTNPWTGFVYSLGPDNEYSRGPFFGLMIVMYALYTGVLFVLIIIRRRHIPGTYPTGILLVTPVIIAVGIALQLLIPGSLAILPSYMICLVLAFLFLQRMRIRNSRLEFDKSVKGSGNRPSYRAA